MNLGTCTSGMPASVCKMLKKMKKKGHPGGGGGGASSHIPCFKDGKKIGMESSFPGGKCPQGGNKTPSHHGHGGQHHHHEHKKPVVIHTNHGKHHKPHHDIEWYIEGKLVILI